MIESITEAHIAYMAGIVDGDGSITIDCNYKDNRYNCCLTITNTSEPMMKEISRIWGGFYFVKKSLNYPTHKPLYIYKRSSKNLAIVLDKIYPYLIIRKKQAEIAKKFCDTVQSNTRIALSSSVNEYRKSLFLEIRELNNW